MEWRRQQVCRRLHHAAGLPTGARGDLHRALPALGRLLDEQLRHLQHGALHRRAPAAGRRAHRLHRQVASGRRRLLRPGQVPARLGPGLLVRHEVLSGGAAGGDAAADPPHGEHVGAGPAIGAALRAPGGGAGGGLPGKARAGGLFPGGVV